MEHPVHHDLLVGHFKIESPLVGPETIERLPITLYFSKALVIKVLQIISRHLKFIQKLQLLQGVELGDLRRTDFVKDNL